MKEWLKEIQTVKQISNYLLQPRKSNYQQDYLIFKISKKPNLCHKNFKVQNQFNQSLCATVIQNTVSKNQICIVFLHGYGSNKLEGLTLVDHLPVEFDLCCFDFSASGKSQGNFTTYGLKEWKDLRAIIQKLSSSQFGYKKFVLWGRSMGAVASFMIACSENSSDKLLLEKIVFQVLDSPFSTFQSICFYQAKSAFKMPEAFISYGIDILKNTYKDRQYQLNPFNIDNLKIANRCELNTLFVYSQKDQIIPASNSLSIINNLPLKTHYQKLLIQENHNQLRSQQTIQEIFKIIHKNYLKTLYMAGHKYVKSDGKFDLSALSKINDPYKKQTDESEKNHSPLLTKESSACESKKQPIIGRREKKYLELFSNQGMKKTLQSKAFIDNFEQHYFPTGKHNKTTSIIYPQKQARLVSNNTSSPDIQRLKRSYHTKKTFHSSKTPNQLQTHSLQKLPQPNNQQQLVRGNTFTNNIQTQFLRKDTFTKLSIINLNNKVKKRALYCSLTKNYMKDCFRANSIARKSFGSINNKDLNDVDNVQN